MVVNYSGILSLTPGANIVRQIKVVILTLPFLGLKFYGKLPWCICLSIWANDIKKFTVVIYHSMVVNKVLLP